MKKPRWKIFPHASKAFEHREAALKKNWPRLHKGDCEPFPDAESLKTLVAEHPKLKPSGGLDEAADALQDAWRAYHRGDFGAAIEIGIGVGLLGYNVANKATNIYATYLEDDVGAKLALFLESSNRAEKLQQAALSFPNAWYLHAQALGRYSQGISVAAALAQGMGGKIKTSLDRAVELAPEHADAHIALGAYHAEIINKVGAMLGGLTYGASKDAGVKHFQKALRLNPQSAIARIEYANGLVMMFGKDKMKEALKLYEEAAAIEPADAMEWFDVELAKEELAD